MNFQLRTIPPVVQTLLIINILAWALTALAPVSVDTFATSYLALFPTGSPFFRPWQLVTYMFLHGGFSHLFFNMFALWMFGRALEWDLGSRRFLLYYMVCGVGAGLIQLLVGWLAGTPVNVPTVGASGAIYGLLLAFGVLHPNDRIGLIFPPIVLKAKWFVVVYGVIELFSGMRNFVSMTDNIAHFAHLGGMLWGLLLILWWRRKRLGRA